MNIDPGQLVYITEIVELARTHDLLLVFLAEATGVPSLQDGFKTIDLDSDQQPAIRPAILEQIASDVRSELDLAASDVNVSDATYVATWCRSDLNSGESSSTAARAARTP